MALTFSEKFRAAIGGKAFRVYEVTHDGSTTAIPAASLDMQYVEASFCGCGSGVLSATSTKYFDLTTRSGTALAMTALSSGCVSVIVALGW